MPSPPPLQSPGIRFWSCEFRDPGLEKKFRQASVRDWARQASLVSMVGGAFFLGGFWVDYATMGINLTSTVLLTLRVLFAALALGIGWRMRRSKDPHKIDMAALTVLLACVAATLYIIHQTEVPSIRHALTVFVFVIVFYVFVPSSIWINVLSSALLSLGFLIIVFFISHVADAVMAMIIIYLALGNLLGLVAALNLHRLRRMQWFNLLAEREARSRLLEEVEERKQAEESLRQLASGVAHNFNNSLMAITSNLQAAQGVLRGGGGLDDAQSFLTNAWQSASSGREVAHRLTRAVVGEPTPQKHGGLVDIGALIEQAQNIARLTWAQGGQALEFRAEIEPGLWVRANRGELIEVFLNLFKNSLEAMESGGCLWVRAMRIGGSITVEVEDDGPGISADIQKRLFKPFASDKGVRGQGLGLAVSRGILQSLGGSINCDSKPGRGTTMIIQLPAGPDQPTAPDQPADEPSAPHGENRRILLVEDEGLVALGVSAILRQEGYQVWQAKDLAEAENMLPEALPEMVLCDFGLPDGNAGDMYQITQRWAGERGDAEPVFVVLTGWSEAQLTDDPSLLAFEPFAWLQKPVDKKELLDTLRNALQKAQNR